MQFSEKLISYTDTNNYSLFSSKGEISSGKKASSFLHFACPLKEIFLGIDLDMKKSITSF